MRRMGGTSYAKMRNETELMNLPPLMRHRPVLSGVARHCPVLSGDRRYGADDCIDAIVGASVQGACPALCGVCPDPPPTPEPTPAGAGAAAATSRVTTAGSTAAATAAGATADAGTTAVPGATVDAGLPAGASAGGSSAGDDGAGDDDDAGGGGDGGAWLYVVITLVVVGCFALAMDGVRRLHGREAGQTDGFNMSFANAAYAGAAPANDDGELYGTNADQATYAEFPETPAEPPAEASCLEPAGGAERLGTISNVSARVCVCRRGVHTRRRVAWGTGRGRVHGLADGGTCGRGLDACQCGALVVAGAAGNSRIKTRCVNHPCLVADSTMLRCRQHTKTCRAPVIRGWAPAARTPRTISATAARRSPKVGAT